MSENLRRLERALADKGWRPQPPPPEATVHPLAPVQLPGVRPSMPAPQPAPAQDSGDWEIEDSFTPEGLAAAGREGARFFGDLLAPVADLGRRVNDWHAQRGQEMSAAAGRMQGYERDIRAANVNTARMQQQKSFLDDMFLANSDDASSQMDDLRGALDARIYGGDTPAPFAARTLPPEPPMQVALQDMSDEELLTLLNRSEVRQ